MASKNIQKFSDFDEVVAAMKGKQSRRLQGNTFLQVREHDLDGQPEQIALLYHATDILLFDEAGIVYNSGGWRTNTTKQRMNNYGPLYISQRNWEWYATVKHGATAPHSEEITFYDGLNTTYSGYLIGHDKGTYAEYCDAKRWMTKRIRRYVDEMIYRYTKSNMSLVFSSEHASRDGDMFQRFDNNVEDMHYLSEIFTHGLEKRGIPINPFSMFARFHLELDATAYRFGVMVQGLDEKIISDIATELRKTLYAGLRPVLLHDKERLVERYQEWMGY